MACNEDKRLLTKERIVARSITASSSKQEREQYLATESEKKNISDKSGSLHFFKIMNVFIILVFI